jgi:foldase protein PrsA
MGEIKLDKKVGDKKRGIKFSKRLVFGLILLGFITAGLVLYMGNTFPSNYVMKVGNAKVQKWEFEFYLKQIKDSILTKAQKKDSNINTGTFWNTEYEGENALEYAKKQTVDAVKASKVQLIKANEAKVKLSPVELDGISHYQENMAQESGITVQEVIKQLTSTYGISIDQYKTLLEEKALMSDFARNETGKLENVPDVKTYYAQNADIFKNLPDFRPNAEEAVWVRHILILTIDPNTMQPLSQEKQNAALKKAQDTLVKAKNGEDFSTLAKQYSEDPGSAQYGGDYVFARGYMDSAFESAAFAFSIPGQINQELIKTGYGYEIVQFIEKFAEGKPVSAECALQYRGFGITAVRQGMYADKVKKWKDEYKTAINQKEYKSIK